MKRQIRRGVFETNSSSTHAICIAKGDYNLSKYIDFTIGEFGWENNEYDDLYSKASYLITAILSFDKDKADDYLRKLKDILENNNIEYNLPKLKEASWEYDGKIRSYYDFDGYGYIDHSNETARTLLTMYYMIQINYLDTYSEIQRLSQEMIIQTNLMTECM